MGETALVNHIKSAQHLHSTELMAYSRILKVLLYSHLSIYNLLVKFMDIGGVMISINDVYISGLDQNK